MAYEPTIWTNREVEKPRTYTLQDNGDGTTTLIPAEGTIVSAGTPIIAENLNNIEDGIVNLDEYPKFVEKNGKVFLSTETDFNNIVDSGWYEVNSAINAPPKTTTNPDNWVFLEVFRHDNDWVLQKAYLFREGVYVRRKYLDVTAKWEDWHKETREHRVVITLNPSSTLNLSGGAWRRIEFFNPPAMDWFGNWDSPTSIFTVPESGYYRFTFRGGMVQSVDTGFYVEVWQIGGDNLKYTVVSAFAGANGWNNWYGSICFLATKGEQYEFVARHTDASYERGLANHIGMIEQL